VAVEALAELEIRRVQRRDDEVELAARIARA
jgi:hypothetical protein